MDEESTAASGGLVRAFTNEHSFGAGSDNAEASKVGRQWVMCCICIEMSSHNTALNRIVLCFSRLGSLSAEPKLGYPIPSLSSFVSLLQPAASEISFDIPRQTAQKKPACADLGTYSDNSGTTQLASQSFLRSRSQQAFQRYIATPTPWTSYDIGA
jgi:hypothetical protein